MSKIVDFFSGHATDSEGRRLSEILAWDDEAWEDVHDFIQWLFPLPERSAYNPDAPLLTPADIAAFRDDERLRAALGRCFARTLVFLGLTQEDSGAIKPGPNFSDRAPDVWQAANHNWLRITRVLRCLTLLGLEDEARRLLALLTEFVTQRRFPIGSDTFAFWTRAVVP